MKGNDENDNGGANDDNTQSVEPNSSTSPPRKKQCLVIPSSSSKSDNEGSRGSDSDLVGGTIAGCSKDVTSQKQGVGETEKQPLVMVPDQMAEEIDSDSDYDYDGRPVLDHTNEDHEFVQYDFLPDNRKIYLICLKKRILSRSECIEYLEKIGCDDESYYLGGSKLSPYRFYARLRKGEADKLACEEGVEAMTLDFFF